MTPSEILTALYESWKAGEETALQCFLRLDRDLGMKGVKRADFEKLWEQCAKYPAKHKLDALTARQNELKNEIAEAMLQVDPPWSEVIEFCKLIKDAQDGPNGLPYALEALHEHNPDKANALRLRCEQEFPAIFKPEMKDAE